MKKPPLVWLVGQPQSNSKCIIFFLFFLQNGLDLFVVGVAMNDKKNYLLCFSRLGSVEIYKVANSHTHRDKTRNKLILCFDENLKWLTSVQSHRFYLFLLFFKSLSCISFLLFLPSSVLFKIHLQRLGKPFSSRSEWSQSSNL